MISTLILASLYAIASAGNNDMVYYYRDLGCTPITEPGQEWPTRYNCSHLEELRRDQCTYKGKQYDIGESIPSQELPPCYTECRCNRERSPYLKTRKAEIKCVRRKCTMKSQKEGCYNQFSFDSCCPVKQHCREDGDVPKCARQTPSGKSFVNEGQRFFASDKCVTCICQEGFNGTLVEPWCREVSYNLHLHYGYKLNQGCVPIFYKELSCVLVPGFRCPHKTDLIEGVPEASVQTKENQCIFGDLRLAKGQRLNNNPSSKCVECSCQMPPHITCTMTSHYC